MKPSLVSDTDFMEAVSASFSIAESLRRLGLNYAGAAYRTFKRRVLRLGVDTRHFRGNGWSRGTQQPTKVNLEDYFSNRKPISSHALKKRLLREGIFARECSLCKLSTWFDKPIPIELDHIDGNPENNQLSNLRILCPNCHAQTPNFRRRKSHPEMVRKSRPTTSRRVKEKTVKVRKITWPNTDEILVMLESSSYSEVGRHLGVSDNAVRKFLRTAGISPPRKKKLVCLEGFEPTRH